MAEYEQYNQAIDSINRGCVLFLLDQSGSMEEQIANSTERKCDQLAKAINRWLENIVIQNTAGDDYKDRMDIGVVVYRTDLDAVTIIENGLSGPLAEKDLVTIEELQANAEFETLQKKIVDEETGEIMEMPVQVPLWVKPFYEGGTPMCSALLKCYEILDAWTQQNANSFPPLLVHITDGENTEETDESQDMVDAAIPYADSVRSLATTDGNVLVLNCHLSLVPGDTCLFPNNGELLPDNLSRALFKMSSIIPEKMRDLAIEAGFDELAQDARMMAYNADSECLLSFLDVGTKVATARTDLR